MTKMTICWTCANATGKCPWSEDFIPVEGWTATPVHTDDHDSFFVHKCPLYIQDALENGLLRLDGRKSYTAPEPEEEPEKEVPKVKTEGVPSTDWHDQPVTSNQRKYITMITRKHIMPNFTGKTRGEAAEWISKGVKLTTKLAGEAYAERKTV